MVKDNPKANSNGTLKTFDVCPYNQAMQALLETWDINARLNLYLLDAVPDEQLAIKLEKGKTVLGNWTHLHNVRMMWLKASAPDLLEGLAKLDDKASREELVGQLELSSLAIRMLIERAGTPEGKIKGFKPHAAGFVGYMVAHEAFHRTCIEIALRQAGVPLTDKVAYGMWEWGSR